ncbi:MAG: hypothetical protein COU11_03815 [Candidatus Harrisonbacteria bacterium CG10_big_fil_rev_8_21_14_0_10_49_15]|uniref:Formamidopyrimidine-DNA glycosylase catalytic domain-containing protein n=1 Tax=Candidatus Harrisonbacteria bacterium CG10_big_fil_rev_8_21_14_0_10_49_15 TaxID=1974587 RepID=A0A2H0UK74_9BACT|nr:MAG: hypothetical protein COU11_03815 [Candidatus Harrisonbacteria bacterium CG10_big_fil_rev_8_21_14_0_10_49_15]
MPELPEVTYFEQYVKRTILNQKISAVECLHASSLRGVSAKRLKSELVGATIRDATRRGKFLILETDANRHKLVLHFGATGWLSYGKVVKRDEEVSKYAVFILYMKDNEYELRVLSKRKLGKVYWVENVDSIATLAKMGPEPLALSRAEFFKLLDGKKRKQVGSFLADQKDLAGIGNEYATKILVAAELNGDVPIGNLTEKQRQRLFDQVQSVLQEAIEHVAAQKKRAS